MTVNSWCMRSGTSVPVVVPVVMMLGVMIPVVPIDVVTARHTAAFWPPSAAGSKTAGLAPLAVMRLHAGGHFIAVGNELTAEPHRVRRAGLLNIRRLGAGRTSQADKNNDRQRQPAHKTHAAHELFLLRLRCPRRLKLTAVADAVDGFRPQRKSPARGPLTAVSLQSSLARKSAARRRRGQRPHSNLRVLGTSPPAIAAGQGSTSALVISAVALSNAMRRQKAPSGMA
jgi:hypothetical protein